MSMLRRDAVSRLVALVVGAAIGLRTLQVRQRFFAGGGGEFFATGTAIGLIVTIVFVGALALWRFNRSPEGTGGPRLGALAGGMILGALVGAVVFGAP